jgi:hypothetical protein
MFQLCCPNQPHTQTTCHPSSTTKLIFLPDSLASIAAYVGCLVGHPLLPLLLPPSFNEESVEAAPWHS